MSWSKNYPSKERFVKDEASYPASSGESEAHVADQIAAARAAAKALLTSGVLGGTDKDFAVNLSGHGNPEHEPADGSANDCITVSIVQVKSAVVTEEG